MLSKQEFKALTPVNRGYAVYMLGARDDQPHVPYEENPYRWAADEWDRGQNKGILTAQGTP